MNIEQFATITLKNIRAHGFADFQPTICLPERRDVRALAGVPQHEDHSPIALDWAAGIADPEEEYLVAFKCSPTEFRIVRFASGNQEHQVYTTET